MVGDTKLILNNKHANANPTYITSHETWNVKHEQFIDQGTATAIDSIYNVPMRIRSPIGSQGWCTINTSQHRCAQYLQRCPEAVASLPKTWLCAAHAHEQASMGKLLCIFNLLQPPEPRQFLGRYRTHELNRTKSRFLDCNCDLQQTHHRICWRGGWAVFGWSARFIELLFMEADGIFTWV